MKKVKFVLSKNNPKQRKPKLSKYTLKKSLSSADINSYVSIY